MKKMRLSILLLLFVALFTQTTNAQTTITVDTGMNWVGYMNVFDSTGANYIFGNGWGVPDLKTEVDAGNGSMRLKPNYSAYDATDPFWSNGALGNKVMEANTYVEDLTLLGQNLTFNGHVDSFSIDPGYTVFAFIKVLDANNGFSLALSDFDTISATGTFSVNVNIPNTSGFIPQYGFTVLGMNGNPVDEAAFGNVFIRGNQAPPIPNINVTFQVQNPDSLPVYVFGDWSGWSNWPGDVMTATTNGIYEATISLPAGSNVEYLFVNGTGPTKEVLDPNDPCTNGNTMNTNRMRTIDTMDVTYCAIWESCTACIPLSVADVQLENVSAYLGANVLSIATSDYAKMDVVEIMDITGKLVFKQENVVTNSRIPVSLNNNSMYILRTTHNGKIAVFKKLVQ